MSITKKICTIKTHGYERIEMNTRKYPLLLVSLMLISYIAPLLDAGELTDSDEVEKSSGRSTACIGDICISEALVNAFGTEAGAVGPSDWTSGEWVEIHNSGTSVVDLATWTLDDHYGRSLDMITSHVVFPVSASNLEVQPGGYIVMARNGDGGSCGFCLKNTNGMVNLTDSTGNLVHSVTFGSTSPTEGVTLIEDINNPTADWVESSTLSPGQSNQGGTPTGPVYYPGDIIINEAMADAYPSYDNATWPDGEWVEVYNKGSSSINLSDWYLEDAAGNIIEFDEGHLIEFSSDPNSLFINPGETRIAAVNGSTNSGLLNNNVEKLRVYWPNGTIADEVNWTTNEPGFSLSRNQGTDSMFISSYPSPNATNPAQIVNLALVSGDIILTEYLPSTNTSGTFPDGKWIEVLNNGSSTIDLNGWSITNGRGEVLYLDPGTMVFNQSHTSATEIISGERRLVQMSNSFDLYDYYEHLVMKDDSGTIVDSAWHSNYFGDNVSMVRDHASLGSSWVPSNWMTPGQPEPGDEPYSLKDLRFSELMPDPEGIETQSWPNSEWLEIYNNDTVPVDLDGWKLKAASSRSFTINAYNFPLQSDAVIQPDEVGLIALNGTGSFYLKASSDFITLVDENSAIVDSVGWNYSSENKSLVASGSSHAGYTTSSPSGETGWVEPAWSTPGQVNPEWTSYIGSNNVIATEYMGFCDDSGTVYNDWIELYNNGTSAVDLLRWRFDTGMYRHFVTELSMIDPNDENSIIVNATKSTVIAPGEYALVSLPLSFLWPVDLIDVYNPDGLQISQSNTHGEGLTPSACQTWISDNGEEWNAAAYPTPGSENVQATDFAVAGDIMITRVSPYDKEFIQLNNVGQKDAYLNDWKILINDGELFECTIESNTFSNPGSSIILTGETSITGNNGMSDIISNDVIALQGNNPIYLNFEDIGCTGLDIPDAGVSISIRDATGNLSDAFVFANGPTSQMGWNGETISMPTTSVSNDEFVYVRGDGCSFLPDTDTAADWKYQWSISGELGTLCLQTEYASGESLVTPIIGPQNGLLELIDWIDGSQTELRIQLYQLQDSHLVQALLDALNRGVSVQIMLDPGCYNCGIWGDSDMQYKNDYSYVLIEAGAEIYEFSTDSSDPYLFLHSKVAVRDSSSIWISSGNWKSSSTPAPGVRGNVEWSVIIDNTQLADMVNQQINLDIHVSELMSLNDYDQYDFYAPNSIGGGGVQSAIQTTISGELITCPENCVNKLVEFIASAENEVLLSQQTLDVDWSYGWGDENPIITALHDAAIGGVSVHLIINGAYLDDDDQEVVDLFNEVWNGTEGLDASAIVMGEDDDVAKLHNKGIIVDGESVLVSSINMGSSAMNRNREMGVIIHSETITQFYLDAWHEDWNRLDNVTDTDQDSLTDKWEVANGLNRTKRILPSGITEDMFDADGDGVNNTDEEKQGSHPLLADTDGDCAIDSAEIAWAQSTALNSSIANVAIYDALTMHDADGDGVKDTEAFGCDLSTGLTVTNPDGNQTSDPDADDDSDGIPNSSDLCPNTEVGGLTDQDGCSSDQLIELADASDGEKDNSGSNTMLIIMLAAAILTAGAFLILKQLESKATKAKELVSLEEQEMMLMENSESVDTESWSMPVLDGSSEESPAESPEDSSKDDGVSAEDLTKFPGWDADVVQRYLDNGWTIEQLAQYYQEQLKDNQ